ncbi:MAG: hypothetical protein WA941_00310 [Nitrososphaeraceae archaeon]
MGLRLYGFFDTTGVSSEYAQNDTTRPDIVEEEIHDCRQSVVSFLECILFD